MEQWFLTPCFTPLYVLTGQCIDPAGINAYAPLVPEEAKRELAEQLRRVRSGEKPDYMPFSADLRWWFAEKWHEGILAREMEGVDLACLGIREVGPRTRLYDVAFQPHSGITMQAEWSGRPVCYARGGYPGERRSVEIRTPEGVLRAVEKYSSNSFGIVEYPIKSSSDLRVLRYLLGQAVITPIPSSARSRADSMGAPKTPMQAFLVELAGIENTAFLMADDRGEMEETMALMAQVERQILEIAAASEVSAVGICENLSANTSSSYFDKYIGPQLSEWAGLLHAQGKRLHIHMDGTLRPLLGRVQDAGVDLANGITAAPTGDVEVGDLREMAGDRIILEGILPQTAFTPVFSEDRFEEFMWDALSKLRDDHRVILGIGDMLPMDGLINRVEKVVKMAREMG